MKLSIKNSEPFIEQSVKSATTTDSIIVGVKVYSEKELKPVRKEFFSLYDKRLTRLQNKIKAVNIDLSLTEDELEDQLNSLEVELETLTEEMLERYKVFYKKQVLFLKNCKLLTEDGQTVEVIDTREVKPIESLWGSPSECLDALLDVYFDDRNYKDSLITAIYTGLFGTSLEDVKAKN